MIYKFKSKAAGDVIMMGTNGDQLLGLIGKSPAAQGIIEPDAMPSAITALEQAVAADDAERAQAEADAAARGEKLPPREGVSLRQRVWPVIELLRHSQAAGQPVVWGV